MDRILVKNVQMAFKRGRGCQLFLIGIILFRLTYFVLKQLDEIGRKSNALVLIPAVFVSCDYSIMLKYYKIN